MVCGYVMIVSSHGGARTWTAGASRAMANPVASVLNLLMAAEGLEPSWPQATRLTVGPVCLFQHAAVKHKVGVVSRTHHSYSLRCFFPSVLFI